MRTNVETQLKLPQRHKQLVHKIIYTLNMIIIPDMNLYVKGTSLLLIKVLSKNNF